MNFIEAIQEMVKGKRLRRKDWPELHCTIMPEEKDNNMQVTAPLEYILANDWEILE